MFSIKDSRKMFSISKERYALLYCGKNASFNFGDKIARVSYAYYLSEKSSIPVLCLT